MRASKHFIGPYEIIRWIAQGGMGTVFLGQKELFGFRHPFAVKQLHPHLARDPEINAMFHDEARIAARIIHPNVATVVDYGHDATAAYLAMDFIDGPPLSRIQRVYARRDETLSVEVVVRIIADVLEGLHAAHETRDASGAQLGIVHRDASPHNIVVGADGLARILDFGVARMEGRALITIGEVIKGKPEYFSPEQAEGRVVDRRSDVFSVGIVLWELLTAERFNDRGPVLEKLARVAEGSILPPSAYQLVTRNVEQACMRSLAKLPQHRFETAGAFAQALLRAIRDDGMVPASRKDIGALVRALDAPLDDDADAFVASTLR